MEQLIWLAAVVALTSAAVGSFNYIDQEAWANIPDETSRCGSGTRQSPIEISSDDAVDNDELINLVLARWDEERDGKFENTGTSVKFTPNDDEPSATTTNHEGLYETLQFHMHWGAADDVGSEHVVDNNPASAEIHFVHRRTEGSPTAGNAFAVVGVMAVVDPDADITGPWSALNVTRVLEFEATIDATVRFSDFLPSNLSYYYYEGSLTTPGCDEVVQWFLLKEPISIPEAYLKQLRMVQHNDEGELLTFNYRQTQPLNNRTVSQYIELEVGVVL